MFWKSSDPITAYESASDRRHGVGPDRSSYRSRVIVGSLLAVGLVGAMAWLGGVGRDPSARPLPVPIEELTVQDGQAEVSWSDTEPCVDPVTRHVAFDAATDPVTVTLLVVEGERLGCTDHLGEPTERRMEVTLPAEVRGRPLVDGACDLGRWMPEPVCFDPRRG